MEKFDRPLDTLHIDHLAPIQATDKLYKYLFIVTDAFTKFTWIYPTKTTNTKEVLDKLKLQQQIFGNPRRIISDRGAAFTSKEFEEYCQSEKMDHSTITTGLPRSNGQVERINQCIIPILIKASETPTKWYKHTATIQQALNSTYQRAIKTTPFELLFGVRKQHIKDNNILEMLHDEQRAQFIDDREEDRRTAKQQILRIQAENRAYYNKKRKLARSYNINDLVAIRRTQFINNKLAYKYLGPYKITSVKPNDTYDVMKYGTHEGPIKTPNILNRGRFSVQVAESCGLSAYNNGSHRSETIILAHIALYFALFNKRST